MCIKACFTDEIIIKREIIKETEDRLCVSVSPEVTNQFPAGSSEGSEGSKGSVKSEEASSRFELTLDITNRVYNASLLTPDSPDYKLLASQVNTSVSCILNFLYDNNF